MRASLRRRGRRCRRQYLLRKARCGRHELLAASLLEDRNVVPQHRGRNGRRRRRRSAPAHIDLRAKLRRRPGDALAGHRKRCTEHEVRACGTGRTHCDVNDAASNTQCGRRRRDLDVRCLADCPAHEAKHAARDGKGHVAPSRRRIEDILVDDDLAVRPNGQRRAIVENKMGSVVGGRRHTFVGRHVGTDMQHSLRMLGRLPERLALDD